LKEVQKIKGEADAYFWFWVHLGCICHIINIGFGFDGYQG
jgi:hypothetical protein